MSRYTVTDRSGYINLTNAVIRKDALPGLWWDVPFAEIALYPWDETGYTPPAHAACVLEDGGLTLLLYAEEATVSGTETRTGGAVCRDSCLEFFVQPFEDDPRYINAEVNCIGTAHIGIGAGREGRTVFSELPAGVKVSAAKHEGGVWGVCLHLPAALFDAVYGRHPERGSRMRGNFYTCDETIHPHFGTWAPVTAAAPDFHRPECFGELVIE